MEKRILVADVTFAGSTAEVAAEVGRNLAERGAQVDMRSVK